MDGSMASDRPLLNGKGSTRAAGCEEGSSHLVFQSLPSVVTGIQVAKIRIFDACER